jgi:serine protease
MAMDRTRRLGLLAGIATLLAAAPGRAVPAVTQVIDGLPQVIAPQQLIFSCNGGGFPLLCSIALANAGATVSAVGQDVFSLATLPAGVSLQSALDTLRASGAIASAEPNRIFLGSTTYPQTWNFPAAGAPGDSSLLPGRPSPFVAAPSPLVAVIDSGVAYENTSSLLGPGFTQAPVFAATPFAPGWDFVNNGPHADDDNGHGTAMATIIAGQGTFSSAGIPYVGPAAGATIMPIKVLDQSNTGTEFWLEEGIRYAVKSGAQVINLSLDFARNYVPGAALRDAIAKARANNVVVVGASGNTGGRVLYPAAFPDVISVGAIRLDAASGYAVTSYSNRGEALDLVAPGGDPNQDVNLDGLWDGVLAQAFPPGSPNQISWWLFAGTSPATAHVSAAAAALIGNGVAPASVRPLLLSTAAPLLLSTAAVMGSSAVWSARSGAGRLQAGAAVGQPSTYSAPAPLFADAVAALRANGRASGAVMIADAGGNGLANVEVHARWRGAAPASQTAFTDASGIARFVSPRPGSQRKLFLLEVPRVIYQGVPQRPRPFARSTSGFTTLTLSANPWDTTGLGLWGSGYSSQGGGLGSGTTGSGLGSGTTGSGDGSGTNTCDPDNPGNSDATYPLTTGVNACLLPFQLFSYDGGSLTASSAFFSGASLASGYSVRSVDSSWVLAPGAAAIDQRELSYICGGQAVVTSQPLSSSYFGSGTLFVAGSGAPPSGLGAGDSARFWAEVMNAEGSTAP